MTNSIDAEIAEMFSDRPLIAWLDAPVYHVTRSTSAVTEQRVLLSATALAQSGAESTGFGHSSVFPSREHVSVTTCIKRAERYFEVLLVLAGIAEAKVSVEAWLDWYLSRWDRSDLFESLSVPPPDDWVVEKTGGAIDRLLGASTVNLAPDLIRKRWIAALRTLSAGDQLSELIELDQVLVNDPETAERGLGVVGSAEGLTSLQIDDVGMISVQLSSDAIGQVHEPEDELRVRDRIALNQFAVVARGSTERLHEVIGTASI